MDRDIPSKTYSKTNITKFSIAFDIPEQQKSNTLISGTNSTGKSRLACGICSILQNLDWRIIGFDNTSIWKQISDLPTFYTVREQRNYDPESKEWNYPYPKSSLLYDTSLLIPDLQKSFVDRVTRDLWNHQVSTKNKQWTLIVLEECQLFMRSIRGSVAQNLLRVASAGRFHKLRVLGITVDLALVDPSFIRLAQQRYHGRLGIEANSKRRFRDYYGLDWCRIACEGLDVGDFIYLLRDKLMVIRAPLFEAKRTPQPYYIPMPRQPQPKPKTLLEKIRNWLK